MPHDTQHARTPRAAPGTLTAWPVLIIVLSTRLRTVEAETRSLARQVQELAQVRDDLLDAADIHALCAHEERLIGRARFYDRSPRATHC